VVDLSINEFNVKGFASKADLISTSAKEWQRGTDISINTFNIRVTARKRRAVTTVASMLPIFAGGVVYNNDCLFVAGPNRILKISLIDNKITTWAGSTTTGNTNGWGSDAKFWSLQTMVGNTENYTTDARSAYILDANQIKTVSIGSGSSGYVKWYAGNGKTGHLDSELPYALFNQPQGITLATRMLYVADTGNHCIRKEVTNRYNKQAIITVAGSPQNIGHSDGQGTEASFTSPRKITSDSLGNLYVLEADNYIRKVSADGQVTTLVNGGQVTGSVIDGPLSQAQFNSPTDLMLDRNGVLYVSDKTAIRQIIEDKYVKTLTGSQTAGSRDGDVLVASFTVAGNMTFDFDGNIYVADMEPSNKRIRKIKA
jgi:hypothetical protein